MMSPTIRRGLAYCFIAASFVVSTSPGYAQDVADIVFTNHVLGSGLDLSAGGTGVSAFDFNDDGLDDITIARRDAPPALLVNNGDGTFTDVALASGITSTGNILVPIWVDVNRDALPDLFLGQASMGANALWLNQGDGTFSEVAADWGINTTARTGTAVFGDFSGDGFPDLFMGVDGKPDLLYRSVEGKGFEDVSDAFGIGGDPGWFAMQATFLDVDFDGDQDLFVTHDEEVYNRFYINQDGTTFEDRAQELNIREVGEGNSMGVAWGDPDQDGDLDVYVTRIRVAGFYVWDAVTQRYSDKATQYRVAPNGVGWGVSFVDLDNDMDEDLVMVSSAASGFVPPTMFTNLGPWFQPIQEAGDFQFVLSDLGLAVGDFDLDGRQDLVIANSRGQHRLMINETLTTGNWLTVELREPDSLPAGVGARLELDVGDKTLLRLVHGGDGYNGQNSSRLHFGLGGEVEAAELRVFWPDGTIQVVQGLKAGNRYRVLKGAQSTSTSAHDHPLQPLNPSFDADTVALWPNPVSTVLSIRMREHVGKQVSIQIVDILGRVVLRDAISSDGQARIDIQALPAGVYFVQIESVWPEPLLSRTRKSRTFIKR